jgi:hypothetical protein
MLNMLAIKLNRYLLLLSKYKTKNTKIFFKIAG